MSKWIDEQIQMAKVLNEHGLEKIFQALKKAEEALNSFIRDGYDREVAISSVKAIEDLGKE